MIPEFDWVQDSDLRDRCLDVWQKGMTEAGWTAASVQYYPFVAEAVEGPSLTEHTRMVVQAAVATADAIELCPGSYPRIDRDVLVAGALLHDVGKLVTHRREGEQCIETALERCVGHVFAGVALAAARGLPPEILHVIATHSREGDLTTRSPEATIVHHADFAVYDSLTVRQAHNLQ
jgi:putative nucleotidyltransferase with HDIG domain